LSPSLEKVIRTPLKQIVIDKNSKNRMCKTLLAPAAVALVRRGFWSWAQALQASPDMSSCGVMVRKETTSKQVCTILVVLPDRLRRNKDSKRIMDNIKSKSFVQEGRALSKRFFEINGIF